MELFIFSNIGSVRELVKYKEKIKRKIIIRKKNHKLRLKQEKPGYYIEITENGQGELVYFQLYTFLIWF